MSCLHITNGDGAADLIKASAVAGDVLPWRDPMHHGPFPAGLSLDALSEVRARYLAGPGLAADEIVRDFKLRDDHLRAAPTYDQIILWFEHDLLDQLQLLQLLDWFCGTELGNTRLELICINAFDGIVPFRGLGQLSPTQLETLLARRAPVTEAQLKLGQAGWAAFCSADPGDLLAFMGGDLAALPFLKAALARHLEEFPACERGLTRTEHQILSLASDGASDPGEIFLANMDLESVLFVGDWRTYGIIGALCESVPPLLHSVGEPFWFPPKTRKGRDAFRSQRLALSEEGQAVLEGERDAFEILVRDCWLGGVHLASGQAMWTWDGRAKALRRRER